VIAGLEQKGYNPGIVVGTSMGAVIGALYASGMSADSITSVIDRQDWRQLFAPYPSPVGLDRSVHYPVLRLQGPGGSPQLRGYVDDWQINRQLLRELFRPSAAVRGDFDRLPRRFRSIAADLRDGELVSIGYGDLARSVRASMAQAGVFSPTTWGNRVLTDGGVSDYLPVAEARRLGAHEVIGVDVIRPTPEIRSTEALAVVDRSLQLLVQHARAHGRLKRGGGGVKVELEDMASPPAAAAREVDVIMLDAALDRLAAVDQQAARVVELRYFGGLSIEEAAEVLGVSEATVKRDWRMAKAWLRNELSGGAAP
jgi:NTE family protein